MGFSVEIRGDELNNFKRFTVCKVMNHDWLKVSFQPSADDSGHFWRCQRCGKENHYHPDRGLGFGDIPPGSG